MLPTSLIDWLHRHTGPPREVTPTGGGSTGHTWRLTLASGEQLFAKTRGVSSVPGLFPAEADNLRHLAATRGVPVPDVVAVHEDWLLLPWLPPGSPDDSDWETLGRHLAQLHQHTGEVFGFHRDNFCGLSPQPNPTCPDGHAFFAEHRLGYQADKALETGRIDATLRRRINTLCRQLPERIPEQPPVLLHGDLWRGNVYFAQHLLGGLLIDPACYYGWAEADLAMTTLFGRFPDAFYHGYQQAATLVPGWENRLGLYNLYHLLNHLNLFGGGYRGAVEQQLRDYGV